MFSCKRCEAEVRDGATCSLCGGQFDFPCAGITEGGWRKLGERKATWKCGICKSLPVASPRATSLKTGSAADSETILIEIKRISSQMESLPALIDNVSAIKAELLQLKAMRDDISDLKASVEFVHVSVESLSGKISVLEQDVEALKQHREAFKILQDRVDKLENLQRENEQRSRMNNIEIKGVPMSNTENLFSVMTRIGDAIGYHIPKEQINYITRIPMRNDSQSKNIICSVHYTYIKKDFVAAAKKHKLLKASDLGLQNSNNIFINDHLTLENKLLLNKTKARAKERGVQYVWVKDCKILIRKNDTSPRLHIKSEKDLQKYLN